MSDISDYHDKLHQMIGTWSGESRLYLEPEVLANKGTTNATITSLLDGTCARIHERY